MPDRRILLVEDDRDVGELLLFALTGEGYTADLAATAADARLRLEAMRYDLVIADWRLPDGDGLMIVNDAADRGSKTMVISGYLFLLPDPDPRHEYLMKPMRPSELIAVAKRLLGLV
jgi:DNA-binding NtrC family response regulator